MKIGRIDTSNKNRKQRLSIQFGLAINLECLHDFHEQSVPSILHVVLLFHAILDMPREVRTVFCVKAWESAWHPSTPIPLAARQPHHIKQNIKDKDQVYCHKYILNFKRYLPNSFSSPLITRTSKCQAIHVKPEVVLLGIVLDKERVVNTVLFLKPPNSAWLPSSPTPLSVTQPLSAKLIPVLSW